MIKPGTTIGEALTAQQRQSLLIPSIQSTPPPQNATGAKSQKRVTLTIADGAQTVVQEQGDFVFVESISAPIGANVTVKPDTGNVATPILSAGNNILLETPYNFLQINNTAGNGQIVLIIWVGFGSYSQGLVRTGPLQNVPAAALFISAAGGAYAVNDCVGDGHISIANFFNPAFLFAAFAKIRLAKTTATVANANFRLFIWNGDRGAGPFVDNAPFAMVADLPDTFIDFPAFVTGGVGSTLSMCDIAGIDLPIRKGTNFPSNLQVQLVALSAYVAGVNESFQVGGYVNYW